MPLDSVAGNTFIGMLTRLIFRNPFQVDRAAIITPFWLKSSGPAHNSAIVAPFCLTNRRRKHRIGTSRGQKSSGSCVVAAQCPAASPGYLASRPDRDGFVVRKLRIVTPLTRPRTRVCLDAGRTLHGAAIAVNGCWRARRQIECCRSNSLGPGRGMVAWGANGRSTGGRTSGV